jgi:CHAD domain-containing protein
MAPRRDRSGPRSTPGLAALVTRRHQALREQVEAAHSGKVEGVHQARVASRRLREVVPVLGTGLGEVATKRLGKDLRRLTRALGPVRELDVAAGMIEEMALDHADVDRLRAAWLHQIERDRKAPVRALHKALAPRRRDKLDQELEAFAAERAASDDATWRDSLARRLTDRALELRTRIARTGTLYRPEPLHDVRIATKKLRYVLEITAETGLLRLARPLRTLKSAQESLGRLHDLDVLFTLLHGVPGASPGQPFQHAAAAVVGTLERQSRRLHARYLRARPALERVTAQTLEAVVPRVQPPRPEAEETTDGD